MADRWGRQSSGDAPRQKEDFMESRRRSLGGEARSAPPHQQPAYLAPVASSAQKAVSPQRWFDAPRESRRLAEEAAWRRAAVPDAPEFDAPEPDAALDIVRSLTGLEPFFCCQHEREWARPHPDAPVDEPNERHTPDIDDAPEDGGVPAQPDFEAEDWMAAQLEEVEREKRVDDVGVPPEIKLPPRDRRASTERAGRAFLGLEEPEERDKAEPEDGGAASSDRCARTFLGAWCCLFVLAMTCFAAYSVVAAGGGDDDDGGGGAAKTTPYASLAVAYVSATFRVANMTAASFGNAEASATRDALFAALYGPDGVEPLVDSSLQIDDFEAVDVASIDLSFVLEVENPSARYNTSLLLVAAVRAALLRNDELNAALEQYSELYGASAALSSAATTSAAATFASSVEDFDDAFFIPLLWPTAAPFAPSLAPTTAPPSLRPSDAPTTAKPSPAPTTAPFAGPTAAPTKPAPTRAPTTTPVPAPTADPTRAPTKCEDDGAWFKANTPSKHCDWVRQHEPRCAAVGDDGRVAYEACREACGCSNAPTAAPTDVLAFMDDELVFWFDFDDGSMTGYDQPTFDGSANGYAISETYGASLNTGPFNTPARFFGGEHGFAMDDVVPELTGDAPRTLGAWLRFDKFDGAYVLEVGGGDGPCENFGIATGDEDGHLELAFTGACAVAVADVGLVVGAWHLVLLTFDGAGTWALYVDGALRDTGAASLTTAASVLTIGGTTAAPFFGSVDDLFCYDVALDDAQVAALYATFAPRADGRAGAGAHDQNAGADEGADSDIDLLATSLHDDTVAWYENDGAERFAKRVIADDAEQAAFAAFADFDEDGDLDVIAVSWGDNSTRLFVNDAMVFTEVLVDDSHAAVSVWVSDMDGDGDDDVIASSWTMGSVVWYENEAGWVYTRHVVAEGIAGPWSVFPGDLDGDGDVDVVVATGYDYSITWYENDGAMGFERIVVDTEVVQPRMVVARDGDGDGDVDIFAAIRGASQVAWYENDGSMDFDPHVVSEGADGAYSVIPADLDGDGDVDVLASNKYDSTVACVVWYENACTGQTYASMGDDRTYWGTRISR
ncbi:hypothetical protein JL722_8974 [Aureococcus anophagefferens]|nr:hypothetical protein JL722_8974 [Aureococcus anophagefferens]